MLEIILPYIKEISLALSGAIAVWLYQQTQKMITNRKYRISDTYVTTYLDIVNGQEVSQKAITKLKQSGYDVKGKTMHENGRTWILNGEFLNGRYYCGVYSAEAQHDLGVGSFYFQYDGSDFDGMWAGYDNVNRRTTTGFYRLQRMVDVDVGEMKSQDRSFAMNLALKLHVDHLLNRKTDQALTISNKTLGPDYLQKSSFDIDYGKGVVLTARHDGEMVGFLISYVLDPRRAEDVLFQGCADLKIDADVLHADREGHLGVIKTVAVDPEFQGRGVGTKLIKSAEARLKRRNASVIVVPAWQRGSVAAWQRGSVAAWQPVMATERSILAECYRT